MVFNHDTLSKLRLWGIFALVAAIVGVKIWHNRAYFLTPDAYYYLRAAQNLLNGRGYRIVFEGKDTFCAIWPLGYAGLIAVTSWLTSFSVETASKLLNLLALMGCFWLLQRRFQQKAWFISLAFTSSSVVQLYANTWSETLFLFFVLGFCFVPAPQWGRANFLWATAAFLARYAAIFLLIPLLTQRRWREATYFSIFIIGYLFFNYFQTQTFTGGHGFWPNEPFFERLWRGLYGIGEEILFFAVRDWNLKIINFNNTTKWLIYSVALLQFSIVGMIAWRIREFIPKKILKIQKAQITALAKNMVLLVAFSYLFFTIVVYFLDSSIESLYFRRLAPSSLLLTIGLLAWIAEQEALFERTKWLFVAFFALSLWHALPHTI